MRFKTSPNLRFNSFDEDWKPLKLDSILTISKREPEPDLPLSSLTIESGIVPKSARYERAFLVKDLDNAYKSVEKNDFVLNPMNLRFGAIAKYNGEHAVNVSRYYDIFRLNESASSDFFEYYFVCPTLIRYYNRMATGSLIEKRRVHFSEFKNFKLPTPSLPEQQKIASFLKSVDKRISLLKRKKKLLAQYKKGVMQQIFSQQIRFKNDDGSEYPVWEQKKLGDITQKVSSNLSANTIESNEGQYPVYGAAGQFQYVDFYKEESPYISIVKDGAGVGRVLLCEGNSSFLGTLDGIRSKENLSNLNYVYYQLLHVKFRKYVTGSTIPHIYYKDYKAEKIGVPCLEEQTKIANFLSAIDTKISHTQKQIELTQQFKKGLLQQMFV